MQPIEPIKCIILPFYPLYTYKFIMLKKILLALSLISTQAIANKNDVIKNLSPFFGKIKAADIVETPFNGVYEVVIKSPIGSVLVSENGRYIIQGDVVDLTTRTQMPTSDRVNTLKKALIDSVNEKDKIVFKAEKEKHIVHVFTDVDCPFCAKLHAQMPKMNELGITVKYLASPLAGLHPQAQAQMEKIWCADDRVKAMDEYKRQRIVPDSKVCDNPVAGQLAIAQQLGVNGTPAIFLSDGAHIPGYLPAESLLKRIER